MNRKFVAAFAALLILAVAAGCASIGNPSGGPRDEQPPRFVRSNPAPGSSGISNRIEKIKIDFNEIVNVKDPMTKVIVSPPSASIPRVASQGKSVTITFRDTLLPNTTYTIDFSNAIEDNNEGNPLENFSYTFSTGSAVDSLRISGIVVDALSMEPLQQKIVGVHPASGKMGAIGKTPVDSTSRGKGAADSVALPEVCSERFLRVARTDDRGRFSIEGLAPGSYRIFALDDADNNFLYSSPEEAFAFSDEIITPYAEVGEAQDSIYNLKLGTLDSVVTRRRTLFYPNNIFLRSFLTSRQQRYVKEYNRIDSTRIDIQFSTPLDRMPEIGIVGAPSMKDWYKAEHSARYDTISLWFTSKALVATDTLRLSIGYEKLDSLQRYVTTTDTLRFTTQREKAKKVKDKARKAADKIKKTIGKSKNREDSDTPGSQGEDEGDGEGKKKRKKDGRKEEEPEVEPTPLLAVSFGSSNQDVNRPYLFELATPAARLDTSAFRLEIKVDTIWKPLGVPLSERRMQALRALPDSLRPADFKSLTERPVIAQDTLNPRRYRLEYPWKFDTPYRLVADSLAITGIYGLSTGKIAQEFKTRAENEYCSLTLRLADWPAELPAFVELLNASDAPLRREVLEEGKVTFNYLDPGKYYVRVINDHDGDGRWLTGDYIDSRLPEEAYYYPKAINIKKNWNKDETWRVFDTPADRMKPEAILKNKPARNKHEQQKSAGNRQSPDEEEEE